MVDKLVRKPDDLKGLKMRIPTRTGAWVIEALGAAPVGMPVPDLPQALSKKVIDGAFIPWEIIPALKLHHFLGPKSPAQVKLLEPWAQNVEKASGGKVKIEIYPSMSLGGKPPQLINQVRDGVVDIVWTVNGYTAGLFPRSEVFELPFVHTNNPAATNLAMRAMFDQYLKPDYKGVHVLFLHVHAGQAIHMVDKLVRKPDDLKGLKMRIPTRTGAWVIEALGASPVGMPVPDLPQALSKKVIDGAFIPWEIIPALKLQDMIKYFIEGPNKTRFGNTTFQVSMNEARWNSLPPDVQKAFTESSGEAWVRKVGEIWAENDDAGIAVAVKAGGQHIQLTNAELAAFKTKLEPVVQRWEKDVAGQGIDGKALVAEARKEIAKYSK
ncbi:MAG: TRAP transporter substrate-binding protein DctP, partial [Burkholderiales bacterium]